MNTKVPKAAIIGFIVFIIIVAFSSRVFVKIQPGERGVLYNLFSGLKVDDVYDQGLKVIAPWNKMYIYDVRNQEEKEK